MWRMVLLTILLISVQADKKKECRALALEGGGSKGAFQVGAFNAMAELVPDEIDWQIVTGVSVGALNAAAVSLFAPGDEVNMAKFMNQTWWDIQDSDVFKVKWPILWNLLEGHSLLDNEPLREFVTKIVASQGNQLRRNCTVGTADLDTATFTNFDQDIEGGISEMIEAVICSSAIPAVFPPQNWRNTTYVDGGSISNLDIGSAIQNCLDEVEDQSQITVDVIFCSGDTINDVSDDDWKTQEIYFRVQEIQKYDSSMKYILNAMQYFPDVNYRYIIQPLEKLPGQAIPLNFKHDDIVAGIDIGYNEAKKVIQNVGTKGNAHEVIEAWRKSRDYRV